MKTAFFLMLSLIISLVSWSGADIHANERLAFRANLVPSNGQPISESVPARQGEMSTIEPVVESVPSLPSNDQGVIEIEVQDLVSQPIRNPKIDIYGPGGRLFVPTTHEDIASIRLKADKYRAIVSKEGWNSQREQFSCEKGKTNHILITLERALLFSGRVLDLDGKPAIRITTKVFLNSPGEVLTDTNGHFTTYADETRLGPKLHLQPMLIARDIQRSLAALVSVEKDSTNTTVQLQPAASLTGKVSDITGQGIAGATVDLLLHIQRLGCSLGPATKTDADGGFEFNSVPPGQLYSIQVQATGYGTASRFIKGFFREV